MKQLYKIFFIIIYFFILSCSEKDKVFVEQAENRVTLFYSSESNNNFKVIDSLISYKLYQNLPYVEFKNNIENKKTIVGDFKTKKLNNYKIVSSTSGVNEIFLEYIVDYKNQKTIENFIIEKNGNNYKILAYNWENY